MDDGVVRREIWIDASPELVFSFFIDAEKLSRWLVVDATLDPGPGGVCRQIHDGSARGFDRCVMPGRFVVVDPPYHVSFTWRFEETSVGVPPGSSLVDVYLEADGAGTVVRLEHRGLPGVEQPEHGRGWNLMLGRLDAAAGSLRSESSSPSRAISPKGGL